MSTVAGERTQNGARDHELDLDEAESEQGDQATQPDSRQLAILARSGLAQLEKKSWLEDHAEDASIVLENSSSDHDTFLTTKKPHINGKDTWDTMGIDDLNDECKKFGINIRGFRRKEQYIRRLEENESSQVIASQGTSLEASSAPKFNDAIAFLDQVRTRLSGEAYGRLLGSIRGFRNGMISEQEFVEICLELLEDQEDLISEHEKLSPS